MTQFKKNCKICKLDKEVSEFYKRAASKDGLQPHCKKCEAEYKQRIKKDTSTKRHITVSVKVCGKCKVEKPAVDFSKDRDKKDGLHSKCKECSLLYRNENKQYFLEYNQAYRIENRDYFLNHYQAYFQKNKEKLIQKNSDYKKEKRKTNHIYALKVRISNSIRKAFIKNGYSKKTRTHEILGCDYETFTKHIESQFKDGMCWERIAEIHLDHIVPISSAKTEDDVIRLNHYTNLQPLWAIDNMKKGARLRF